MKLPFSTHAEDAFEDALAGRPEGTSETGLVGLAQELRDAGRVEPASSVGFSRGRTQLLTLVEQRRDERRRAGVGKFKGAALSVAALAGGGLVVASAANGANPVTLAIDMAREISGPAIHAPTPAREFSFEAEVIASDEYTLDVRLDGRTIRVEPAVPANSALETDESRVPPFETGTMVRITGREPAADNVTATKIEVVPNPTKPATTSVPAKPEVRSGTAAPASPTKAAVVSKTATPLQNSGAGATPTLTPTSKPSPTPTPKPVLTAIATATAVADLSEDPVVVPALESPPSSVDEQKTSRLGAKTEAK